MSDAFTTDQLGAAGRDAGATNRPGNHQDPTPGDRLRAALAPTWIEAATGFPARAAVLDPSFASSDVVAVAEGQVLTESQILHLVAFAEFLAGVALDPLDREQLWEASVADFLADPHTQLADVVRIAGAVAKIGGLSPLVRARLRQRALVRVLQPVAIGAELAAQSAAVQLVARHQPIVAAFPEVGAVVTDGAIRATADLRRLVAAVAGVTDRWNEAAFRAEIDRSFNRWPEDRQLELAAAEPTLVSIRAGLRALADDDQDRLAATIAAQAESNGSVEVPIQGLRNAGRLTDLVAAVKARLAERPRPAGVT
ncbi:MAG: hypothetical protein AAF547_22425 [Actinomycetota bacterium]